MELVNPDNHLLHSEWVGLVALDGVGDGVSTDLL